MRKKGVYSYDYMDSFEKFSDRQLPEKKDFYSLLTDEGISDDKYNHAREVWDIFKIKDMGEYHDLYRKSDILLLADVFEQFSRGLPPKLWTRSSSLCLFSRFSLRCYA